MAIRDVWADNLAEEMANIRKVVEQYPYVGMDTEFPGVVARPVGAFASSSEFHYQTLRCNVDLLRLIQIGLCFCDAQGNHPEPVSTWQFNFRFSLHEDMYATESVDLLNAAGINFQRHQEQGIDALDFAELLTSSGLVLLDDVRWISFHSGYDFGYLVKLLNDQLMPATESEFSELLRLWFPSIYDIKYIMKSCKTLKGGLQEVADDLQVARLGTQHQAGSDSHLTASAFFKMRSRFFEDVIDDSRYLGVVFGLGQSHNGNGRGMSNGMSASSLPTQAALGMGTPSSNPFVPTLHSRGSTTSAVSGAAAAATPPPSESHAIQIRQPPSASGATPVNGHSRSPTPKTAFAAAA